MDLQAKVDDLRRHLREAKSAKRAMRAEIAALRDHVDLLKLELAQQREKQEALTKTMYDVLCALPDMIAEKLRTMPPSPPQSS